MIKHIDFNFVDSQRCQRLFHGRGQAYPGLESVNVDWLPPVALITLYKEPDRDRLLTQAAQLKALLPGCLSVQVQYRCRSKAPFEVLCGDEVSALVAEAHGLKFHVQLGRAQNIGLFLDMSNGWQWVRDHAAGKRVLNLFAYTCAFSVAAIAGGAEHVVNVDVSKAALSRGRENHRLNQQDTSKVTFQGVDIFKSFSRLKKFGPYDLLVCDPPAFQKGSVDIKRDYHKIIRRIPELMRPGGQLMLCLNSAELTEQFLHDLVATHCPGCRYIEKIVLPEVFNEPDADKALKVLVFDYHEACS